MELCIVDIETFVMGPNCVLENLNKTLENTKMYNSVIILPRSHLLTLTLYSSFKL